MPRSFCLAALLSGALFASGCSSTLKATTTDATGRFPTGTKLDHGGVKINKPFQEKYRALLYVKIDDSKVGEYRDFFVKSFANSKVFTKVQKKEDIEKLVIERQLSSQVSNVSDLVGLNNLARQIGPFLVVEPGVEWKGGYDYVASLKAVDPENGETVLYLEQKAFNWAGLDKPLFYPLFNAFVEWANGQTIQTRAAPKPVKKRRYS